MKNILILLLCASTTVYADLTLHQKVSLEINGVAHSNVMETSFQGLKFLSRGNRGPKFPASFILTTTKGTFSCLEAQKICTKSPDQSTFATLNRMGESGAHKVTKLEIKPLGTKSTVAGYSCTNYEMKRESESQIETVKMYLNSIETACFSSEVKALFPIEFIEQTAKTIPSTAGNPAVRKALESELALGVSIRSKIVTTQRTTSPGSPPVKKFKNELEVTAISTTAISPETFEIPKGYRLMDLANANPFEGGLPPGMKLPAEALKQLRKMKSAGDKH